MKLVYEGSVKNIWQGDDRKLCEFEYTDAYSVFDWGRMPDVLSGKGEALASIAVFFFKEISKFENWQKLRMGFRPRNQNDDFIKKELDVLCGQGMPHHFVKQVDPTRLQVQRVGVFPPQSYPFNGQMVYSYPKPPENTVRRLIPLEVVFRFGMPPGSSLKDRLTPEYAKILGLSHMPQEGEFFEYPVIEYFTKLEETDRILSIEQALNYSGLRFEDFTRMTARSFLLALYLRNFFQSKGLELWDGKFEWALLDGDVVLVDSIGPDELRLIEPHTKLQISKEFLRQCYRNTYWFEDTKQAKDLALKRGVTDWKAIVLKERGGGPKPLEPRVKQVVDALYPTLATLITSERQSKAVSLSELVERMKQCLPS